MSVIYNSHLILGLLGHKSKSRCSRNPPDWLTHMMHWPCLSWVSLQALQEEHKHHMPETKMWPPSRRMHYFKVLCAWGTAYSTVYLHIIASAKCNTSVGNDNYQRLETDTDSTLATGASLKLPWSLAKQSWQTSLAVKHQTAANPCVWCCLLMYEIWVTILQYEVACSCCVHVTSVDVMIIILINTTAQVFVTVQGFILCKDWCCSHCKTGTQPV